VRARDGAWLGGGACAGEVEAERGVSRWRRGAGKWSRAANGRESRNFAECKVLGGRGEVARPELCGMQSSASALPDLEQRVRSNPTRHSYDNGDGGLVCWTFEGLFDLRAADDPQLEHGTEMYSLLRRRRAADYVVEKKDLTEF
jgi:hypothetical protein